MVIAGTVLAAVVVVFLVQHHADRRFMSWWWTADTISSEHEAVLRDDLFTLRSVVDQYTLDKQRAPESLQDLIDAGYLKQIPVDPMTNLPDWQPQFEDVNVTIREARRGLTDVHSQSKEIGSDGRAYSEW